MAAPRRQKTRGFTLIETALSVVIIGTSIVAMCQLLASGTVANVDSTELSTGMNLARNVREFSMKLAFLDPTSPNVFGVDSGESATNTASYDDINDLYSSTPRKYSPPIDGRGVAMSNFSEWSQVVTLRSVNRDLLWSNVTNGFLYTDDGFRAPTRVTVEVYRRNTKVCELTWYAFDGAK